MQDVEGQSVILWTVKNLDWLHPAEQNKGCRVQIGQSNLNWLMNEDTEMRDRCRGEINSEISSSRSVSR